MIRLTKIVQCVLRFAWEEWRKNTVRFPAYVLVRTRTQENPNKSQVYRSR